MTKVTEEIRWYGKRLDTTFNHVRLVVISDVHYGNPFFSEKHFRRTLEFIEKNDDVFCFLNGDLCECALKTSKGDVHTQKVSPQSQRDDMIDYLLPIKGKIIGMVSGNHEARIYDLTGIDISSDIAKALNVPYQPDGMLTKISFGDGNKDVKGRPFVFWNYATHGYGGARTKSAKAVKAERTSTFIHAHAYEMSHDHVVNVAPNVYLMPDDRGHEGADGFISGKVTAHREMLIKTNAYLKWGGYSERGGFPPTDLATPVIMFLSPKSDYWQMFPDKPRMAVRVMV